MNSVEFFLGVNTPNGFYSLFNELYNPYSDWRMFILKGGPGTGKSTIMKAVAKEAEEKSLFSELIYCSSDPSSLDGVIIPEIKVAVADGTSPHTIEPVFAGICEQIVNLGDFWNTNKLNNDKAKIKMISITNSAAHKNCVKYMKAAKILENETEKYTAGIVDKNKIDRYANRFLCVAENKTSDFAVKNRFLSALSPMGIKVMNDTVNYYCDDVTVIRDNYNIAHYITDTISNLAIDKKISMIVCRCSMEPLKKIDHIIFPDLRKGIFTSNQYHNIKGNHTISSLRFVDRNLLNKNKNSLLFINKAKKEMINEAVNSLKTAKSAHDILESYYIDAMDFDKVNNEKNLLLKKIFN